MTIDLINFLRGLIFFLLWKIYNSDGLQVESVKDTFWYFVYLFLCQIVYTELRCNHEIFSHLNAPIRFCVNLAVNASKTLKSTIKKGPLLLENKYNLFKRQNNSK
jgi:hypothetical protein